QLFVCESKTKDSQKSNFSLYLVNCSQLFVCETKTKEVRSLTSNYISQLQLFSTSTVLNFNCSYVKLRQKNQLFSTFLNCS
ncbi:hypothetical protein L9F63_003584, partial [Diploptera punctata]